MVKRLEHQANAACKILKKLEAKGHPLDMPQLELNQVGYDFQDWNYYDSEQPEVKDNDRSNPVD